MYHRTGGFTEHERDVYKSLVSRLIHEGRVIDSTFLDDQPNLRPTFAAIRFDCVLTINEKICPVFVPQSYKSVRIIRNLNGTISIAFIINNFEITLSLEEFTRILKIPCQGICMYTPEWPISSLLNGVDSNPNIYPPPHEDSSLIREACLTGNKDYPNACLCYMLHCLTIGKPFNLAYYIASRMVSVTKSADMTLPYEMLLTRLFEHVRVNHPYSFSNELYLVDHMMIPLSEKMVFRFKDKGKRPRLPTLTPPYTESSDSPSLTPHQGVENDPLNNYTLDPIPYMNQILPIEGGDSPKFKQTKGMFKCLFHFLSKKK
ncbi:hypothetical protein Tco_0974373 [Tanacetum coccineum]|uniref:Uncharacterized protein n=1 Tax=Tanacetum coccineum TaxID=301880 RepID=A0ABQ5EBI8_9ASTR